MYQNLMHEFYSTDSNRILKGFYSKHSVDFEAEKVQQPWFSLWNNSKRKALNKICHCRCTSSILLKHLTLLTGLLCGRCTWSRNFQVTLLILSTLFIMTLKPWLNWRVSCQVNFKSITVSNKDLCWAPTLFSIFLSAVFHHTFNDCNNGVSI